jgi:hypothetical protein
MSLPSEIDPVPFRPPPLPARSAERRRLTEDIAWLVVWRLRRQPRTRPPVAPGTPALSRPPGRPDIPSLG